MQIRVLLEDGQLTVPTLLTKISPPPPTHTHPALNIIRRPCHGAHRNACYDQPSPANTSLFCADPSGDQTIQARIHGCVRIDNLFYATVPSELASYIALVITIGSSQLGTGCNHATQEGRHDAQTPMRSPDTISVFGIGKCANLAARRACMDTPSIWSQDRKTKEPASYRCSSFLPVSCGKEHRKRPRQPQ